MRSTGILSSTLKTIAFFEHCFRRKTSVEIESISLPANVKSSVMGADKMSGLKHLTKEDIGAKSPIACTKDASCDFRSLSSVLREIRSCAEPEAKFSTTTEQSVVILFDLRVIVAAAQVWLLSFVTGNFMRVLLASSLTRLAELLCVILGSPDVKSLLGIFIK
jgi:hypothetical protein